MQTAKKAIKRNTTDHNILYVLVIKKSEVLVRIRFFYS